MLRDVRLSGFFLVGLLTTTPLFAPPGDDQGKSHVPTRFRAAPLHPIMIFHPVYTKWELIFKTGTMKMHCPPV